MSAKRSSPVTEESTNERVERARDDGGARYVVGIDLGTTNSVVAYASLDDDERPRIEVLQLPQLVAPGTVESRESLPSFLYLAAEGEVASGAYDYGGQRGEFAVGEVARLRSAEAPQRTVGAAKSWLCHDRVDRRQPLLPWNAPEEIPKISPVTASRRYLEHLVAVWNERFPEAPLGAQRVVLTVPASFDAGARELTREAALAAGLPGDLVLLEEPQAAVYAWLDDRGDDWRKHLKLADTLLVCDVGGGTTDLTLVEVGEEQGEFQLRRRAVGDHLLVGGDNMDLALAYQVSQRLATQSVRLDPWQSVSLWHSCRAAKETLLAPDGPATHTIAVQGRGSRLIGGTVSVELSREDAGALLSEGFFPRCELADRPQRQPSSGFQEIGLPYEHDTAVTRHVAAFLNDHGDGGPVRPTLVLFNGGVFRSATLQQRLLDTLAHWFPDEPPRLLPGHHDLDRAVARGAAYYGWAKHRGGVRIRGGTARAYYVGIETAGLAIPGAPRPLRALCVAPIGMEEGTETAVPSQEIGLVVGQSAQFRFFSSSTRKQDHPGSLLDAWVTEELQETAPVEANLPRQEGVDEPFLPVKFHTHVTELGMLELWCQNSRGPGRWKLEFSVREE